MGKKEKEFVISICDSVRDNRVKVQPVTWSEFVLALRHPQPTDGKDKVPLFSPAEFKDGTRSKKNATKLSMFVLDIDNPQVKDGKPPVTMDDVCKILLKKGVRHALASSWSHTDEWPKFRVVLPLAHPIKKEYWMKWAPAALEASGLAPFKHAMDTSCLKNTAAIYYFPSAPDGEPWVVAPKSGEFLAVAIPGTIKIDFSHIKFRRPPKGATQGDYTTLDVVDFFQAHDAYLKPGSEPGLHLVVCPWIAEHTKQKIDTATCVKEGTPGKQWPSFQCFHSHCAGRTMKDVLEIWTDAGQHCARSWDPMREEAMAARGEKVVLQASAGEAKNAPSAAPQEEKSDGEEPPAGPVLPLPSNGNKSPYVPDPSAECKDGFPTTVVELLKRYVYVSVMDKVLDRKKGAFMSCSSLRNTISGRQFQTLNDGWVNLDFFKLPRRRMCTPDEIVFNPSKKVKFPKINLFTGFHHDRSDPIPREEVNEKVEATLLLLHYMCGQEAEYVLKWLAYPLIYPGAKMRSSLIIHGSQGIGKNLVFERAMIGAYGIWGRLIDQRDLDSAFNGWISKKLYIVADEVATDKRKIDTSNLLKSWITGGTVSVNEKNLPVREEENHCNFVFLSNNSIPIFVDEDDRRYCVVRVPDAPMDTEMYNQVASDLWETKGLHWYQYLKSLDVPPEFIREKVPHNLAKVELKQSCKNSTDLFLDEFGCIEEDGTQDLEAAREGRNDMRLPYGPCKTTDLYRGYRVWCKWNGISHPVSHRSFTMRGPAKRKWIKGRTASNRYVVPPEVGEPETHWKLDEVLEEFEKAVDTYNDRRGAA